MDFYYRGWSKSLLNFFRNKDPILLNGLMSYSDFTTAETLKEFILEVKTKQDKTKFTHVLCSFGDHTCEIIFFKGKLINLGPILPRRGPC